MSDTLLHWRDQLLGDPGVRTLVERLPFGRMIAGRHATRLFRLMTGIVGSQMMLAALDLGVFDQLRAGPVESEALTRALALPPRGFDALIRALLAMGIVERRSGDRLALSIDGLVVASDPGIRAMIEHGRLLARDLTDPASLLRTPGRGAIARFWPYRGATGDPEGYSALMSASQSFVADALCRTYRFGRHGHVMDVGGGDGSFLERLAVREPALRLTLVDLPPVASLATARLRSIGLSDRIHVHPREAGAPLPAGADAITLVRVLHDHDDGAAVALLRAVASALPIGGVVVIAEPMARSGRDPQTGYFAVYFAAMGSGRLRSRRAIADLMREAGLAPSWRRARRASPMLWVITGIKRHH